MYVEYTARRSIVSGHVVDGLYGLEFMVQEFDDTPVSESDRSVSLSGNVKTVNHRIDRFYRIRTAPILEEDTGEIREFLDSVLAGESFVIDPRGTGASPDNPVTVVLDPIGYTPTRQDMDFITFSFKVRLV